MTTRRSAPRKLDQPATSAKVIAWLAAGGNAPEIAKKLGVSRQAVHGFIRRHRAAIDERKAKLAARVEDVSLADQEQRIRELQRLYLVSVGVLEERGPLAEDFKFDKFGGKHPIVRFDAALIQQLRGIARDIAEEKGEIVRKSESVVTGGEDDDGNTLPVPLLIHLATDAAQPQP